MKVNVDLIDILEYKNLTAKNQAWEAILAHLKTQFQQNNLQKFGQKENQVLKCKSADKYLKYLKKTFGICKLFVIFMHWW